jgi:cell division protease FtsH
MDGGRMNRFLRTASFWALIVLIPLLIFQLMNSNREAQQELTYSEFRSQVQGGNVESVTIQEGRKLEGILRSSIEKNGVQVENFHTLLPFEADKALIDELEEAGVQSQGEGPGSNWVGLLVGVLPWLLIIGLWVFLFRQMQSGGSRAFSFGKSKAKLLSGDTPKVTFADVAGCDEAKEELEEIIEFLKDPAKFSRLGGRHRPSRNREDAARAGRRR